MIMVYSQVITVGVLSVMLKKKYNRCMLVSIWLLTSLSILIAVLLLVFVGMTGYPNTLAKLSCATNTEVWVGLRSACIIHTFSCCYLISELRNVYLGICHDPYTFEVVVNTYYLV